MDFPNMQSLTETAIVWKFRKPNEKETEQEYRMALHAHVLPNDRIEAFEIKFRVGWDKWNKAQNEEMLGLPL